MKRKLSIALRSLMAAVSVAVLVAACGGGNGGSHHKAKSHKPASNSGGY
jgi:hypothetical protein